MKVLTVFLSILTTLFISPTAYATENFYMITSDEAIFYSSENFVDESALFIIPKGYYVVVKSENTYGYAIEYSKTIGKYVKLSGFIKKEAATKSDAISPIFPDLTLSAIKSTTLYNEQQLKTFVVSILSGQRVAVYGYSPDKTSAFVSFNSEFGYINLANFETFEIPPHPVNSLSTTPKESSSPQPSSQATSTGELPKTLQILLIVFICIPVVVITILIFSFSPKEKKKKFYE